MQGTVASEPSANLAKSSEQPGLQGLQTLLLYGQP